MRKAVISVYRYQELEGYFKENAKGEFYNSMDDSSWDDNVRSKFTERMAEIGFTVDKIFCTLNYSQGDGAMFEGYVSDWSKLLPKLSELTRQCIDSCVKIEPNFLSMLEWKVKHNNSMYYHENSGNSECYIDIDENDEVFSDLDSKWDIEDDINDNILTIYKDECRKLYKELRDEYDVETDNDAISSFYESEDAWFTSFGERVYPIEVLAD